MKLTLLPGLDGTGRLFAPFLSVLPSDVETTVVTYPDTLATFESHVAFAADAVSKSPDSVLIAESFSGQVALCLLTRQVTALRAVVLVSTYGRMPHRWLARVAAQLPAAVLEPFLPLGVGLAGMQGSSTTAAQLTIEVLRDTGWSPMAARLRMLAAQPEMSRAVHAVPVLCIDAANDRLVPRSKSVAWVLPNAKEAEVNGPHLLMQARPTECWREIKTFVDGLPTR
jgi:pimeloyl-ACP methyl ester carboxylesterase